MHEILSALAAFNEIAACRYPLAHNERASVVPPILPARREIRAIGCAFDSEITLC